MASRDCYIAACCHHSDHSGGEGGPANSCTAPGSSTCWAGAREQHDGLAQRHNGATEERPAVRGEGGTARKLLERFQMWRLRRKLWHAAGSIMACGQHNGAAQSHINDAKDSLYAAVRLVDRDSVP